MKTKSEIRVMQFQAQGYQEYQQLLVNHQKLAKGKVWCL
jgi:hypothetical protein